MDAHMLVAERWLEPLVQLIQEDRSRVAVPEVDNIDINTMVSR